MANLTCKQTPKTSFVETSIAKEPVLVILRHTIHNQGYKLRKFWPYAPCCANEVVKEKKKKERNTTTLAMYYETLLATMGDYLWNNILL